MRHVGIFTLGQLSLEDDLLARQHQPIVMLAYLAHTGKRDRVHLAELFWPQAKNPRNNLSSVLTRIRQEAPDLLDIDTHQISCNWDTDAAQMLSLLAEGRVGDGLALYNGPFLDGFQLRTLGEELESWIYETRDTIAATVANAAVESSRSLLDAGQWSKAADMAEHAVTAGGLSSPVVDNLDFLYGLLAGSSRLAAQALRTEAESIGYALDDIGLLRPPSTARTQPVVDDFVGRSNELAELSSLARPGAVVNLYGLGGAGKSSIARRYLSDTVARANDFPGGCHAITLDAGRSLAVTDAVQATLEPLAAPGTSGVIADMIERPTLVLIDDVDPTEDTIAALDELREVRDLCTVVVSRIRIDAPTVDAVMVRGLATRPPGEQSHSPAAELFIQRAGHLIAADEPGEPVSVVVEDICRRLSGLPLAIELTAAWLRMLPVSEIPPLFEDEELLGQAPPGENLSLGRVIERTWDMLDQAEQTALTGLAIMRNGFTRSAAREVADVRLSQLTRLHDYSLIDIDETGRMRLHALIGDFASRALDAEPERRQALASSHRTYYASLLEEAVAELSGPEQGRALARLRTDHANIEAAWTSLVEAGEWDRLEPTAGPLDTYLLRAGRLTDARRLFAIALEGIAAAESAETASLAARLTNNLAWVQMLAGRNTEAIKQVEHALATVPDEDRHTRIALLRTRCAIAGNAGDPRTALDGYLLARELAVELGDERTRALLHEDIGRCYGSLGDLAAAETVFRETLDAARSLGDPHMEARSYLLLAATTTEREPKRAMILLDEGASLATEHGFDHLLAYFPKDRGFAHLALGQIDEAITQFGLGIELGEQVGDRLIRLGSVAALARALLAAGDATEAIPHIRDATRAAIKANAWPDILGLGLKVSNAVLAAVGTADQDRDLALRLRHFCAEHPLLSNQDRARELVDEAEQPAIALAPDSRLDETCERILQLAQTL